MCISLLITFLTAHITSQNHEVKEAQFRCVQENFTTTKPSTITAFQLQSEIAHLDVAKRQKLLTGAELPIIIPAEQTLAMKADLGIPWAKLRIVNR